MCISCILQVKRGAIAVNLREVKPKLRIPAIAAPMFLVSGPEIVIAACRSGIIGSFPANNARTIDDLDRWMCQISESLDGCDVPWAVNIMVHRTYARTDEEVQMVLKHKPPIVITALGSPASIVDAVHSYGGIVLADVNSVSYARKAAAVGVDGLVLVSAGAGGHTGALSAFGFVPAVREFFDGIIVLGGAIGSGQAVRAAEILGADFAYLGTRLIASEESIAPDEYKAMLVEATIDDIILSASLTGIPANWLRQSLLSAGYNPDDMGAKATIGLGRPESSSAKRWRDVWSAGQGVDAVTAVQKIGDIVDQLEREYKLVR